VSERLLRCWVELNAALPALMLVVRFSAAVEPASLENVAVPALLVKTEDAPQPCVPAKLAVPEFVNVPLTPIVPPVLEMCPNC
jgi:hypothetical protein